jgi:hypothetical protein
MNEMYGRKQVGWSLCTALASLALEDQNAEMLKAILEEHSGVLDWDFNRIFDKYKHEGGNLEIISIVENSGFENVIPPGKRFSDVCDLEFIW